VGNSYLATNPFAAGSSSTPMISWQGQFGLMYSLQVWKMKKKSLHQKFGKTTETIYYFTDK